MKKENLKGPTLKDIPREERPREKMIASGVSALSNSELLAVLLDSGSEQQSAVELASDILKSEYGGLQAFSSYEPEEFMKFNGIGPAKACRLVAAIELGRRVHCAVPKDKPDVSTPDAAAAIFMEEMRYLKKEFFRLALLNVKNELIMKADISIGDINSAKASPREIFPIALKKGADSIILVHNHPSGDPTPSAADIECTKQICDAGRLLNIRVCDHIIIGDGCYVSLHERGLMD